MTTINTTLANPILDNSAPNSDPYLGYLDLSQFQETYTDQMTALFAGDPPLISTPHGKAQFQQILSTLNILAGSCAGSQWAKVEADLETAYYAYVNDPTSDKLAAFETSANSFFANAGVNVPIPQQGAAAACIKQLLVNFQQFISANPSTDLIEDSMNLLFWVIQCNAPAEGGTSGQFWLDHDNKTLPDGETYFDVLMKYRGEEGTLPPVADLQAVIAGLINDL